MAFHHPQDPREHLGAAAKMGKLVAQGLLEHADAVEAAFSAADQAAPRELDRRGLRARVSWAITDSAEAWRAARGNAEFRIRRDIRPMIDRRAPAIEIVRLAHEVNERIGEPLVRREVVEIVGEALQDALRFMRIGRRRRVG